MAFRTEHGVLVPAVTAEQMREVDRIAVEEFGLAVLQMMENAGRVLAAHVLEMLGPGGSARAGAGEVALLAGAGGNGGGGLCCARHLHNHGVAVTVLLDRDAAALRGPAHTQMAILLAAGVRPLPPGAAPGAVARAAVVVDALIGYGLRGVPTGRSAELIALCNRAAGRVLALDVPSGLDATTGAAPGPRVQAVRTLTLALPKTGLRRVPGDLHLADIGIPPEVYRRLGLAYSPPFPAAGSVRLAWAD